MFNKTNKSRSFSYNQKQSFSLFMILIVVGMVYFVGFTLAFFADSGWANNGIGMAGKVLIEAVGNGNASIEDTHKCNLEIDLDDEYSVLIPGMPMSLIANCKVYQSTTSPLLRAKIETSMTTSSSDETEKEATLNIIEYMSNKLMTAVTKNGWTENDDGYLYYVGTNPEYGVENDVLLKPIEVDDTQSEVVDFINTSIEFPTDVGKSYSGLGVKFKITFQAIQDFIPDDNGQKMENTIANSKKIFDSFDVGNS